MKLDTPKKKFIFAAIVVFIVLLLVIIVSSSGQEKEQTPTGVSATPTPAAGVGGTDNLGGVALDEEGNIDTEKPDAKWETYYIPNEKITFQLPPQVKISGNENVTVVDVGIDNSDLEYAYDIKLRFIIHDSNGRTVSQIAQSDLNAELGDFVELINPLKEVSYGDNNGYTYSVLGLGQVDYYYFDIGNREYLRITAYIQDPQNTLAVEIIENILASIKK